MACQTPEENALEMMGDAEQTEYRVTWEIDITADSPRDAARQAFLIQRDPGFTMATVFEVRESLPDDGPGVHNWRVHTVDLSEPEED